MKAMNLEEKTLHIYNNNNGKKISGYSKLTQSHAIRKPLERERERERHQKQRQVVSSPPQIHNTPSAFSYKDNKVTEYGKMNLLSLILNFWITELT
jgi:hypothetical protein